MKFEQYLIEKESDELKTKLKDSDDYLKAPNGKPSNLPEKQWLMVRTKSFKNWFGDWEKNPDSASKIIDENGEPMIVYHSALSRVNEFKPHGQFMGYTGISGISVTDTKAMAERYLDRYGEYGWIDGKANQKFDKHTMSLFVNARNPLYRDEPLKSNISLGAPLPKDYKPMLPNGCDALIRNDAISRKGGVKHSTAKNAIRGKEIVLLNPNQVKSIDNKGSFSKSSNNINESTESTSGFADSLKSKYGIQLSLIGRGDEVELVKIIVPKESRNDGVGTKVMKDIINWADDHKKIITLTPSSDFGGNKSKLIQFYKRFGFVENKGSFKDYEISDTMYRLDSNNRK